MSHALETAIDWATVLLIVIGLVWLCDVMVFGFDRPGLFT